MASNLKISICESFVSPAWGSELVIFSDSSSKAVPEEKSKKYLSAAQKYASRFGVYLVPHRFSVLGSQGLCLISPQGNVITAQQEIFTDKKTEIKNSNLNPANTEFGTTLLCVNDDILHPELPRIAFNRGVKLIISSCPVEHSEDLNHRIIGGAWNSSQSNNLFTVGVTNLADCICAPSQITRKGEGFLMAPTKKSFTTGLEFSDLEKLPDRLFLNRLFYYNHEDQLVGE